MQEIFRGMGCLEDRFCSFTHAKCHLVDSRGNDNCVPISYNPGVVFDSHTLIFFWFSLLNIVNTSKNLWLMNAGYYASVSIIQNAGK